MSNAGYGSKTSASDIHLSQFVKKRYAQKQRWTHFTTCHHRPIFPAHRIGSAGTGKDLRAADCYNLGGVADSRFPDLEAHCRCPDCAD